MLRGQQVLTGAECPGEDALGMAVCRLLSGGRLTATSRSGAVTAAIVRSPGVRRVNSPTVALRWRPVTAHPQGAVPPDRHMSTRRGRAGGKGSPVTPRLVTRSSGFLPVLGRADVPALGPAPPRIPETAHVIASPGVYGRALVEGSRCQGKIHGVPGGFAQAPAIARAVLASLGGEHHTMHALYSPERFSAFVSDRESTAVGPAGPAARSAG